MLVYETALDTKSYFIV